MILFLTKVPKKPYGKKGGRGNNRRVLLTTSIGYVVVSNNLSVLPVYILESWPQTSSRACDIQNAKCLEDVINQSLQLRGDIQIHK